MDHLVNNADKPLPSADASEATADDDEDDEGLKAHVKKMGGAEGSENDLQAKVSFDSL